MDELKRMFNYFLPFCSLSFIRRQGGRRKWKRFGPIFCLTAFFIFYFSRSKCSIDDSIEFIVEDDFLYKSALIQTNHQPLSTQKAGITVHIAMTMLFVGQDPHASASFKDAVTWVVVYSSAPVHFHIVSDTGSLGVIEHIFKRAERQSNCKFTFTVETIDNVFEELLEHLRKEVPHLKLPILQEHVVTQFMPLVLAWHFKHLQRVIYINNRVKFRTDVVELYEHFELMNEDQTIGVPLVQDGRFASSFAVYRHLNSGNYLGLAPPQGFPGYNSALVLLDFDKMRKSSALKRYIDLETQFTLIEKYEFKTRDILPKLDEWITLMAVEKPDLFYTLPCNWNVQPIMDSNAFEYCRSDIKAMEFDS